MSETSKPISLIRKRVDEKGRGGLISLIELNPDGCTLTVARERPGPPPLPQKARAYKSVDDAKAAEPAFLKEAANHEYSAACGRWERWD